MINILEQYWKYKLLILVSQSDLKELGFAASNISFILVM